MQHDTNDTDDMIVVWTERSIVVVLFCATVFILRKEHLNRKQSENQPIQNVSSSRYQTLLNVFSLSLIITSVLSYFCAFVGLFPTIACNAIMGTTNAFWFMSRAVLTLYQIARLQYCFMHKQVHSKKYGYPQWMFYILYGYGFFWWLSAIIQTLFNVQYFAGKYKCRRQYQSSLFLHYLYTGTVTVTYYLWDWLVLLLYIAKIIQIKRKKTATESAQNNSIILDRVDAILDRILLLTIFYELTVGITAICTIFLNGDLIIHRMIRLLMILEPFTASFVVYFMIENINNNRQYFKCISILYTTKICFCLSCLMDKSIKMMNENKQNMKTDGHKDHKEIEYETGDISIELKPKSYVHQSEKTQTEKIYH